MNPKNNQPNNSDDHAGHRWAPGQNPFYTEPLDDQLPMAQPEVYNSPSLPNVPYATQSAPRTSSSAVAATPPGPNKLVIVAIAGVVLVIILGVVALVFGGGTKPATQTQVQKTSESESMKPATALDLQQAANAVGQDISGADDEKDFPTDSLDAKALNL